MRNIEDLRKSIDEIDKALVKLFEARMDVVKEVADYKKLTKTPLVDAQRESELIQKNIELLNNKSYAPFLSAFYKDMMAYSRNYQRQILHVDSKDNDPDFDNKKVAFQGVPGSFSYEALHKFFNKDPQAVAVESFEGVFQKVERGQVDFGILPIDNSSTGGIHEVYDLLKAYELYIVGEYNLRIHHCLLAQKNASIDDIEKVYSHEQGFKQCIKFLKSYKWMQIPYYNTAKSAEYVASLNNPTCAAIGNKITAELFGLEVLKENIEDYDFNTTRFIIVSKKDHRKAGGEKISLMVRVHHEPGQLFNLLEKINDLGVNMLKIESRPIADHPWSYIFYIDIEGNIKDASTVQLLKELRELTTEFYFLGNYNIRKDTL